MEIVRRSRKEGKSSSGWRAALASWRTTVVRGPGVIGTVSASAGATSGGRRDVGLRGGLGELRNIKQVQRHKVREVIDSGLRSALSALEFAEQLCHRVQKGTFEPLLPLDQLQLSGNLRRSPPFLWLHR